jgi:hypothetical protein
MTPESSAFRTAARHLWLNRSPSSRRSVLLLCIALLAFGLPGWSLPARAQTEAQPTTPVDPDPWRFNAAGYGWLINIGGSVTARGQTVDTNASFIDLVQKSQSLGGLMAYFEADKGKAGMYVDFVYTNLAFGANTTAYRNPIAGLQITASASAALTYKLFIVEIGGVYELFRRQHSEASSTAIDGVMAFRYWNNSVAASFDADANVDFSRLNFDRSFGLAIARADTIQWVDPVFGVRVRHQFTPHQEFTVRGDIGGFGLGSQFSWQAVAVYSYAWQLDGGQKLAALLGFRALGVNYASGSGLNAVGINETLYGPIIGVSYRF